MKAAAAMPMLLPPSCELKRPKTHFPIIPFPIIHLTKDRGLEAAWRIRLRKCSRNPHARSSGIPSLSSAL
jgi:hypothetical protein